MLHSYCIVLNVHARYISMNIFLHSPNLCYQSLAKMCCVRCFEYNYLWNVAVVVYFIQKESHICIILNKRRWLWALLLNNIVTIIEINENVVRPLTFDKVCGIISYTYSKIKNQKKKKTKTKAKNDIQECCDETNDRENKSPNKNVDKRNQNITYWIWHAPHAIKIDFYAFFPFGSNNKENLAINNRNSDNKTDDNNKKRTKIWNEMDFPMNQLINLLLLLCVICSVFTEIVCRCLFMMLLSNKFLENFTTQKRHTQRQWFKSNKMKSECFFSSKLNIQTIYANI